LFVSLGFIFTELVFPGSIAAWLMAINKPAGTEQAVSIFEWVPATLPGLAKSWILSKMIGVKFAIGICISGGSAILYLLYLIRSGKVLSYLEVFPGLLIISYLMAPYGWIFDQAILLLGFLALLPKFSKSLAAGFVLILNAGFFFLVRWGMFSSHEQLILFAILIACLWLFSTAKSYLPAKKL
ncbi:MAG: hypothetical protein KDD56_04090, partial [Bdellovibrionales bacterium]|nr:hypothetical protein [Bdellovibrionales bacterium]